MQFSTTTVTLGSGIWNNNATSSESSRSNSSSSDLPVYDHTQRLRLDFTPDEKIDNDYVQDKCCKFWDFIHSIPEIQYMMVKPEVVTDSSVSTENQNSSATRVINPNEDNSEEEKKGTTAISVVGFVNNKNLINPTFEDKMPRLSRTPGSRDYLKSYENPPPKKEKHINPCHFCVRNVSCTEACDCGRGETTQLKALVNTMQDWDNKHPQPTEPPCHPANLQHCVLNVVYPDSSSGTLSN